MFLENDGLQLSLKKLVKLKRLTGIRVTNDILVVLGLKIHNYFWFLRNLKE